MSNLKLKDIAAALKISSATVSKALKGYPDVNPLTRKRVLEYTEKVGFKPQYRASSLRTGKSGVIGIILPSLNNLFFLQVLEALVSVAHREGLLVIPLSSNEKETSEQKNIDRLVHHGVDAIFLSLSQHSPNHQITESLQKATVPIFLFDKVSKQLKCPKFFIDDRKAAFEATQHLIDQGCKRIAHFRISLLAQTSIDRFLGYREALDMAGLPYDKSLVQVTEEGTSEQGAKFVHSLLQNQIDFDGVFAINDELAIGAITALQEANVLVPEQVAVVGFSNSELSTIVTPRLSSVDQNPKKMAETMLLHYLKYNSQAREEDSQTINNIIIPSSLIVRESSRRIKSSKI